jgi:hypothetical protein
MTPSKAILAGSVLIAAAIIAAAALFLPERGPAPTGAGAPPAPAAPAPTAAPPLAPLPAPTAAPTPPAAQADRYQIVKVENGASWRLDRQTGEMTYCRVEGDRMICAKSTASTELPRATPEQLKAERELAEKREAKESEAMFDRVLAMFDRFLKFIERQGEKSPPPPQPGGAPRAP